MVKEKREDEAVFKFEREYNGNFNTIAAGHYTTTGGFDFTKILNCNPSPDPVYNLLASSEEKLIPWYNHIRKRKGPITLMVMPTNRCNLNCDFCSNSARNMNEELSLAKIRLTFQNLPSLKAIEITGGGDPLCHPLIGDLIHEILIKKLQVGLITNGILLKKIQYYLQKLHWLRISLNGIIDSKQKVPFEIIPLQLYTGTTYILHEKSPPDYLDQIKEILTANPILQYCKICGDTRKSSHSDRIEIRGEKTYFYDREFHDGNNIPCYLGSIKPVLAPDGRFYPCSNLVLKTGAYEAGDSISLEDIWNYKPVVCTCKSCFLWKRNEVVSKLLIDRSVNFV